VVRVNRPGGGLAGSHTMAGTATPFGIDPAQLPAALAVPGVHVIGFHLHAVSNNLDGAAHAAFVTEAVSWVPCHGRRVRPRPAGGQRGRRRRRRLPHRRLDRPDPAVPGGRPPRRRPDLRARPPVGRDAGWYATEVLDVKTTHGRTFAVVRGGTHHFRLPAAWGYSHPFTVVPVPDWPHPYPRPGVTDCPVDAVGELCTPRDVLSRRQHVTAVRAGDLLVFGRTGAYGWDISHHEFLRTTRRSSSSSDCRRRRCRSPGIAWSRGPHGC